jgi:hypothetical protein
MPLTIHKQKYHTLGVKDVNWTSKDTLAAQQGIEGKARNYREIDTTTNSTVKGFRSVSASYSKADVFGEHLHIESFGFFQPVLRWTRLHGYVRVSGKIFTEHDHYIVNFVRRESTNQGFLVPY